MFFKAAASQLLFIYPGTCSVFFFGYCGGGAMVALVECVMGSSNTTTMPDPTKHA
jgi:hypothetical protein